MKYPNIFPLWAIIQLAKSNEGCAVQLSDGSYVPARPLGWQSFGQRLKATWLVFTGRADALVWPGNQ